ncbi:MAG: hypothetical protein WDA09_02260 [Bacteriovoracaceae bacterium]
MKSIKEVLLSLHLRGLTHINDEPTTHPRNWNCWGWTAYFHGWIDSPCWLGDSRIESFLKEKTVHADKPHPGDIAVFRTDGDYLLHTSIIAKVSITGNHLHLHKPGSCEFTIESTKQIYRRHRNYERIKEYRTLIKEECSEQISLFAWNP